MKEWTSTSVSTRLGRGETLFRSKEGGGKVESTLSNVEMCVGLLTTHSCAIDDGDFFSFAIVYPLSKCAGKFQEKVKAGTVPKGFMFLPATTGMPDAVINLSFVVSLDAIYFGEQKMFQPDGKEKYEPVFLPFQEVIDSRVAALNESGLTELYTRQIEQMTRPAKMTISHAPSDTVFTEDAKRPKVLPHRGWTWPRPAWLGAPAQREPEQIKLLNVPAGPAPVTKG